MTTVSVVTSATGAPYRAFLPEWARSLAAVTRAPDEIIVAIDDPSDPHVLEAAAILPITWVPAVTIPTCHGGVIVNDAIAAAHGDWIARLDVDDLVLPHAYDHLDSCHADVHAFGFRADSMNIPAAEVTASSLLASWFNPLASCSPFRRWLWEAQPYRDVWFDDWAFWLDAADHDAVFCASTGIDYVYRQHPGQVTRIVDRAVAEAQVRSRV